MELRKKSVFAKKLEENRKKKLKFSQQNVKHPLCEENLLKSQELVKCVLNHPSMPQSRYLPNVGTVVDNNIVTYHDNNDDSYGKNTYKYLPSEDSPLGLYLAFVKKMLFNVEFGVPKK